MLAFISNYWREVPTTFTWSLACSYLLGKGKIHGSIQKTSTVLRMWAAGRMAGKKEGPAGAGLNTELLMGTNLGCWERFVGIKPALALCLSALLPEMGNLNRTLTRSMLFLKHHILYWPESRRYFFFKYASHSTGLAWSLDMCTFQVRTLGAEWERVEWEWWEIITQLLKTSLKVFTPTSWIKQPNS